MEQTQEPAEPKLVDASRKHLLDEDAAILSDALQESRRHSSRWAE
jgi:hypothetical protein